MKEAGHTQILVNPHTGITEEGAVLNGERNGTWKSWDKEGDRLEERSYQEGSREGLWTTWWGGGKALCRKVVYEDDAEHGPVTLYHKNGNPFMVGKMNRGRMDGLWEIKNSAGDPVLFLELINDTIISFFPSLTVEEDFDGE